MMTKAFYTFLKQSNLALLVIIFNNELCGENLELDESQTKEDPSIFVRASTIRPGHTCSYVCMYIYILPHKRENTRVLRRSSKISTILYTCRYILTWCDKTCLTMSTSVILVERFHLRFRILD